MRGITCISRKARWPTNPWSVELAQTPATNWVSNSRSPLNSITKRPSCAEIVTPAAKPANSSTTFTAQAVTETRFYSRTIIGRISVFAKTVAIKPMSTHLKFVSPATFPASTVQKWKTRQPALSAITICSMSSLITAQFSSTRNGKSPALALALAVPLNTISHWRRSRPQTRVSRSARSVTQIARPANT